MSGPILICGCPGGGTSLVTKMLRYAGLFAGADAGPREARKYHESNVFVESNRKFLDQTIGFPHAPKADWQFVEHVEKSRNQLKPLLESVDRERLLNTFWGEDSRDSVWGWKDPRNSATALIWRELFPTMRVLIIRRQWTKPMLGQPGKSEAGIWFRTQSDQKLRQMYYHPAGIEGLDRHEIDFDKLLTDPGELESMLQWCDLPTDPVEAFEPFLKQVGVEP